MEYANGGRMRFASLGIVFASIIAIGANACGGRVEPGTGSAGGGGGGAGGGGGGGCQACAGGGGYAGGGGGVVYGGGYGGGSGYGGGTGGGGGVVPYCPPAVPQGACSDNGLDCTYPEFCVTTCLCSNNEWACTSSQCPPSTCPATPPTTNSACTTDLEPCNYGDSSSCDATLCICVEYPSGGLVWECMSGSCADAGH